MAPPKPGGGAPPVPHIAVAGEVPEQTAATAKPAGKPPLWKKKPVLYGAIAAVVLLLGGGAFFFLKPAPPPPPLPKPKAAAPKAPPTKAPSPTDLPAAANKPAQPSPTPAPKQDGKNPVAQSPSNAGNKAKDADPNSKSGTPADGDAAPKVPSAPTSVSTNLAPGVSAPNSDVQAAAEASAAFRAFVANAKIGGLFQGAAPRLLINGRTVRVGDTIDAALAVEFGGYDAEKKNLIFKDKSGATVTRRYP